MALNAEWIDSYREPKCAPDPAFPAGMIVDVSEGAIKTCAIELPIYPTPRCGTYIITCDKCGQKNALTTAGRPDDPRRVIFGCYAPQFSPSGGTRIVLPHEIKRIPWSPT